MLEVGNGGMTDNEYRTHMSLWAILAAPLLAGNDLSKMSEATLAILGNKEVIAVDQDPAGVQGYRLWEEGPYEIWMKPLADGSKAVGLFNRNHGPSGIPITVRWRDLGLPASVRVRDLWAHNDLGSVRDQYTATVPAHGVVMLRVSQ
jgi:alpha-galactosidase